MVGIKARCKICGMRTWNTYQTEEEKFPCCEPCEGKYGTGSDKLVEALMKGKY